MKTLAEFTRTTLIGGVLIILPIYIAVLLLAKTIKGLLGLLQPVAERVPASVEFRQIVAIVLLVCVCFLVGLIVRTGPGLRAKNACERAVLERLPGYTFLRGLAKRLAGQSEEQTLQPALVELEDALVPALIVEELEDGSFTVLVPSAPTPMAGSVYILPRDRVHPVDIPFTQAIGVFSKWGTGAGEFVRAMRDRAGGRPGHQNRTTVRSIRSNSDRHPAGPGLIDQKRRGGDGDGTVGSVLFWRSDAEARPPESDRTSRERYAGDRFCKPGSGRSTRRYPVERLSQGLADRYACDPIQPDRRYFEGHQPDRPSGQGRIHHRL